MKHILYTISIILTTALTLQAQSVGIGTDTPDSSSQLDITSDNSGILIPRMTDVQRDAIADPATGLLVFVTQDSAFYYYDGSAWTTLDSRTQYLIDFDKDTKVQVEESADEDIIRFDMGGTEYFRMVSGRLEVMNSGQSVYIGNASGVNDDLSDNVNVAVGDSTLYSNTTGHSNTASGYRALTSNTTGNTNTANGRGSLSSNETGRGNTANGAYSLNANTTGNDNTAIGVSALPFSTTGIRNTACGNFAMNSNFNGSYNAAFGRSALSNNFLGNYNTGIGYNAGVDVDSYNLTNATAIGANSTVSQDSSLVLGNAVNVGIGTSTPDRSSKLDIQSVSSGILIPRMTNDQRDSIANPTTGLLVFSNTDSAFYYYDGAGWVTFDEKITVVIDADKDTKIQVEENSDDDIIRFDMAGTEYFRMMNGRLEVLNTAQNIFIGAGAGMHDDMSDNSNVAVGDSALFTNTAGRNITAMGNRALYANTSGFDNTAFGNGALSNNTLAICNSAIGFLTLEKNTLGAWNTAAGAFTLGKNLTGSHNTASGFKALSNNTTGSSNTAFGREALENNKSGNFNTAIGYNAGVNVADSTLTNATAIGANSRVEQDNSLVLGGTGAYAVNVGIGTTSPTVKLDVSDVIRTSGDTWPSSGAGLELAYDASQNRGFVQVYDRDSAQSGQLYLGSGNVGIGVLDPTAKMDIAGGQWDIPGGSQGDFRIGNSSNGLRIGVSTGGGGAGDVRMFAVGGTNRMILGTGTSDVLTVNSSGNVGIGTISPTAELHVVGNIHYTGTITDISDRRLKENFSAVNDVLSDLHLLAAYSYNMKGDAKKVREYGLIAQDVQKVFPEMVRIIDEENGYLGVSYIQMVPVLVEAVKELSNINDLQKVSLGQTQIQLSSLIDENERLNERLQTLHEESMVQMLSLEDELAEIKLMLKEMAQNK